MNWKLNGHNNWPVSRHCPYTPVIMATLFAAMAPITAPLKLQVLAESLFAEAALFDCLFIYSVENVTENLKRRCFCSKFCFLVCGTWYFDHCFVIQSSLLQKRWNVRIFRMTRLNPFPSTSLIERKSRYALAYCIYMSYIHLAKLFRKYWSKDVGLIIFDFLSELAGDKSDMGLVLPCGFWGSWIGVLEDMVKWAWLW